MSQRWVKITEQTLATYQAGALLNAYKSVALAPGQSDPLPDTIAAIVLKIRDAIKSGGYSVDSDESKIPASLTQEALAILVAQLKPRLNKSLTETENANYNNAISHLYRIADGKFSVSKPDDPEPSQATTQATGGASLVRPGANTPKLSDYAGL